MVIAIDGPAGAGKSTIAQKLAEKLRILYFDSGAVYRVMTLLSIRQFGTISDKEDYSEFLTEQLPFISLQYNDQERKVFVKSEDVTLLLRQEEITRHINIIANNGKYREKANTLIRRFAQDHDFVIDGRDIGTVVFPETPYKFYLDASPQLRAERRYLELQNAEYPAAAKEISLDQIRKDMERRDYLDQNREFAPLVRANDAHYILSDGYNIEQVVDLFLQKIQQIMNGY